MTILWRLYIVGSLGICSHNKDPNVRGRKSITFTSISQTSPIAPDSVSSLSVTPLFPSNPTQLPCRGFYSAAVFCPYSFVSKSTSTFRSATTALESFRLDGQARSAGRWRSRSPALCITRDLMLSNSFSPED